MRKYSVYHTATHVNDGHENSRLSSTQDVIYTRFAAKTAPTQKETKRVEGPICFAWVLNENFPDNILLYTSNMMSGDGFESSSTWGGAKLGTINN